jgi:hypothetical protein
VKQSIDGAPDDHVAGEDDDDDRPPITWAVAIRDDCDACGDLRVELTLEDRDHPGTGLVAHLAPSSALRLRAALTSALKQLGQLPD